MATKRVEDLNLHNIVNHQFQRAAQHLKYPGGLLEAHLLSKGTLVLPDLYLELGIFP